MLPTTIKKVWFFWGITALALGILGMRTLGLVHFNDSVGGFLSGFMAAFFLSSILVSIHFYKTHRQGT